MRLDWIEIGTSDFDTLAGCEQPDDVGLSIEPVGVYLERLPARPGLSKLRAAIGETSGDAEVWYIPPELIAALHLPWWARGCNAIGGPHPTLASRVPADAWHREPVPVLTMADVLSRFGITGIGRLKIDAEGADAAILRSLVACCDQRGGWPERIEWERNALTENDALAVAEKLLVLRGFTIDEDRFSMRSAVRTRPSSPAETRAHSPGRSRRISG